MGLPSVLLFVQLAVGLYAAVDQLRAFWRPWSWTATVGRVVLALVLIPLALDGLVFQTNLLGQILYLLDLDLNAARLALVALLLGGALLWSRE
jgi:hypothetical protein